MNGHWARRMQSVQRGGGGGHGHYEEVREGLGWATDLHVQNFLECVRTRKTPTATINLPRTPARRSNRIAREWGHDRRIHLRHGRAPERIDPANPTKTGCRGVAEFACCRSGVAGLFEGGRLHLNSEFPASPPTCRATTKLGHNGSLGA